MWLRHCLARPDYRDDLISWHIIWRQSSFPDGFAGEQGDHLLVGRGIERCLKVRQLLVTQGKESLVEDGVHGNLGGRVFWLSDDDVVACRKCKPGT